MKVLPENVEALGAEKGQGLDVWARGGKPGSRNGSKGEGSKGAKGDTNQKPDVPANVIEWRAASGQLQRVSLPATPQAAAVVGSVFKVLHDLAEHLAVDTQHGGDAAALVRSAATVVKQLGLTGDQRSRGCASEDRLQLATRFVEDLDTFIAEQPSSTPPAQPSGQTHAGGLGCRCRDHAAWRPEACVL